MKLLRSKATLLFFNIFISGIPLALILFMPALLKEMPIFLWFFVAALAAIFLSPLGRMQLGYIQNFDMHSNLIWVAKMLGLQFGFCLIFVTVLVDFCTVTSVIPHQLTPSILLLQTLQPQYSFVLLSSLCAVILVAVAYGISVHCKGQESTVAQILKNLHPALGSGKIGYSFEMYWSYGVAAALFLTLVLFSDQLISGLLQLAHVETSAKSLLAEFIAMTVMCWYFCSPSWQKKLEQCVVKRYAISTVLAGTIAFMIFAGTLLTIAVNYVLNLNALPVTPHFETIKQFSEFIDEQEDLNWLAIAWLICCIPFIGSAIARFSKGRHVWSVCLVSCIVPSIVIYMNQQQHELFINILLQVITQPWMNLIVFVLLLCLFRPVNHLHHLFIGYINEESLKKYRSPKKYFVMLAIALVCAISFLKLIGGVLFAKLLLMSALPALTILVLLVCAMLKLMFSIWRHSELAISG